MSTILVVEDNAGNQELLRVLLEMAGHVVRCAETADDGIALARELRPDLILMDMHLPGMDGYEATRIIKKDADLKRIPVIAVTAISDRHDEEILSACGCDGFIAKPIDTRQVAADIAAVLERSGARNKT